MERLKTLRQTLERKQGERTKVETGLAANKEKYRTLTQNLRKYEQARDVIRFVGLRTQEQLQYHISEITSLAMNAVLDDPYELRAEFIERRNKIECDLFFVRDNQKLDPLASSGYGAVDVASFALRITSHIMQKPKPRDTIILDEPFKFLSVDMQENASAMLKELSEKLGLQFIIITHEMNLTNEADKIFKVSIKRGISNVTSE